MFKKILTLTGFSLIAVSLMQAQPCSSSEMTNELKAKDPQIELLEKQHREYVADYIANHKKDGSAKMTTLYTIPVVFHIIHNGGSENVSDAIIHQEIAKLNKYYSKTNSDITAVIPFFDTIAADCQIEFKLAQLDPEGNCTNGIDRIQSQKTYVGDDGAKLNPWPRDKYLNIWVVNKVRQVASSGVTLGYAYFPSSVTGTNFVFDGPIVSSSTLGNSPSSGEPTTVAHEIGHYLALYHPWGSGEVATACGDDFIYDTPETKGSFSTCNLNLASCNPPIIENVQNIMDYSSCTNMFTRDQKTAMHATLNSPIAGRNNLWQPANLIATGVNTPTAVCAPKADFYFDSPTNCVGSNVIVKDNSYDSPATSYSWNFANATPATATSKNVTNVVFNGAGYQYVSLTSFNSSGQDTKIKTDFYTFPSPALINTLQQDFEYISSFSDDWYLSKSDKIASYGWSVVNFAGRNSTSSAKLNSYFGVSQVPSYFITPPVNITSISSPKLEFYYSCATAASNTNLMSDKLIVYGSTNCGKSWTPVYTQTNSVALANAGFSSVDYAPTSTSNWTKVSVTIPNILKTNKTVFKFEFTSAGGSGHVSNVNYESEFGYSNNIYIDDINIGTPLSTEDELSSLVNFHSFPNPTESGNFSLVVNLQEATSLDVTISNNLGQTVYMSNLGQKTVGTHLFDIDLSNKDLSNGIYFINLKTEMGSVQRKIIFN
ncbi:MAG: T9SS type A sorting domain-containing protein [Bacteroidetes bacterium]|nr:T9SS type A sorting domain-containing protein [Bacteroidota bacterium]